MRGRIYRWDFSQFFVIARVLFTTAWSYKSDSVGALAMLTRLALFTQRVAIAFYLNYLRVFQEVNKHLRGIWVVKRARQLPSKNENILKSVTIDGTVCKRVNRCDRVASVIFFATNPVVHRVCVLLWGCGRQGDAGT
jgi:hypothetical protein